MVVSGYAQGDLSRALQTAKQQYYGEGREPFQLSKFLSYVQLDFLKGQMRQGELFIMANFPAIRDAVTFNTKGIRQPSPSPDPVTAIKAEMVPSDTVKQPLGTDLSKSRERKNADDKPSMVPLFVGACAILGFIAFR